jgi:hypothetical protein
MRKSIAEDSWHHVGCAEDAVFVQDLFEILNLLPLILEFVHGYGDLVVFVAFLNFAELFVDCLALAKEHKYSGGGNVDWQLLVRTGCGENFVLEDPDGKDTQTYIGNLHFWIRLVIEIDNKLAHEVGIIER